jgi:outer membrane immunogenic protein
MSRLLIGTAMSLAMVAGAAAADLPPYTKAPPPAVYSWTGFYVGGTAGAAWGSFDPTTSIAFIPQPPGYFDPSSVPVVNTVGLQSINPTGFTGGVEAGYNWQVSNVIFGVETDLEYLGLTGTARGSGLYPCCAPTGFTINSSARTDWLWTFRPRLGIASGSWLYYVTGGVAVTSLNGNFTFSDNANNAMETGSISSTKAGYTVGGGIEAALWGNWSVKAEYLYVDFGTVSTISSNFTSTLGAFPAAQFTHSIDLKANIARVGLNYKFN